MAQIINNRYVLLYIQTQIIVILPQFWLFYFRFQLFLLVSLSQAQGKSTLRAYRNNNFTRKLRSQIDYLPQKAVRLYVLLYILAYRQIIYPQFRYFYVSLIYIYSIDRHISADFMFNIYILQTKIHKIDIFCVIFHGNGKDIWQRQVIFMAKTDQIYPQVSHYIAHYTDPPLNGFQNRNRCGQYVQVRTWQKDPVKFISIDITDGRPKRN